MNKLTPKQNGHGEAPVTTDILDKIHDDRNNATEQTLLREDPKETVASSSRTMDKPWEAIHDEITRGLRWS